MNSKKKYLFTVLLLCAAVILGAWGINLYLQKDDIIQELETAYRGDFEEFYEDMALLSSSLEKCTLTMDEGYIVNSLADAAMHASSAKETLSHLPVSQVYAGAVQSVLSKGEQFAKATLRSFIGGNTLTQSEKNSIRAISTACDTFLDELDAFYEKIDHESYSWIKRNADHYFSEADDTFSETLASMGEGVNDLPDINYDGMYSSHIDKSEYKGLSENAVDKEDIMNSLKENIGEGWTVEYSSEGSGDLATHSFTATDGNNTMYAVYSQNGGKLIMASSHNYPDITKISFAEALEKADSFIDKLGHENMHEEYYEVYNNILSVTYAYEHEGIKCLSDTLTVQVSMKDGKILGYEASDYYKNHYDRTSAGKAISTEQARENVHEDMIIKEATLCYLPTEGGNENLCYEFLTQKGDGTYLVYIDAQSGKQRDIVKVSTGEDTFRVEE